MIVYIYWDVLFVHLVIGSGQNLDQIKGIPVAINGWSDGVTATTI